MTAVSAAPELVSVTHRYRWMLACRLLLTSWLVALHVLPNDNRLPANATYLAVGWLATTGVMALVTRTGRGFAGTAFTVSLLGDGVVLGYAWHTTGGLAGDVGYLIVLHGIGSTLLASFRTGAKIALWHTVLALMISEAGAAGIVKPVRKVPEPVEFGLYLGILFAAILATAAFAAVNERELRRRRYDSEVLRRLADELVIEQSPMSIVSTLAKFAREELVGIRAAVVAYPLNDDGQCEEGYGYVAAPEGPRLINRLPVGDALDGLIRSTRGTAAGAGALLLKKISPTSNPNLAELLPEARNVLVVPFSLEQATGLLMVEYPSRMGNRPARVERRVLGTAQQAATHASTALGRAILTERIRAAATTDGLTKVANRRTFDEALAKAIAAANSREVPFALVLIDLDHFKKLNDRHGHLAGDDVLRGVAAALRATCREGDLAARYGGEEFAAILSPAGPDDALVVAERIRLAISNAETPVPVTASLGVALGPVHGQDATTIIGAADAALYVSKEGGRNRVSMAHADGRVPQAA